MSHVCSVVLTFTVGRDDDLAAAAVAAREAMAVLAATLPDPPHDDPRFEAPHVHRLMERIEADPSAFVEPGTYDRFVWAGSYNAFCVTGELRRPSDAITYLTAFLEAVAGPEGWVRAVLLVSPEEGDTDVYTIEVDRGTTTLTEDRFAFDL